ncbi:MAG: hypothetical protein QOJ19_794 [Acidimicrobiia bacterium]|nr:hypothetical protein [Acidimicrobiia bacterium]
MADPDGLDAVLRRALVAHPNAVALILQLHPRSFAPEPYDAMIDILDRNGVPPGLTLTVLDACDGLVFGWALHSAYAASVSLGRLTARRGQRLARLYEQSHHDDEARFEMACDALVQGFSAEISASSPRCGPQRPAACNGR